MTILSLAGIIGGLLLFILLCFRRVNTILSAVLAALVMIVCSLPSLGMGVGAVYTCLIPGGDGMTSYMGGVAGFLKSYLLLFMLSALYGKVMDDSGAIRRIALSLKTAIRRSKNAKFLAVCVLPVFYIVLGYCGISGFVMVFAVVALGRELFSECDVPWRFYCYGSLGNLTNGILAGNLQAQNLKAAELFGVSITAGAALSLVFCAVQLLVAGLMIWFEIRACDRRGEGFYPEGSAIMDAKLGAPPRPEEELPGLFPSLIPIVGTVLMILIFKAAAEVTLTAAILLCFVMFRKNLAAPNATLSAGLTAGVGPVVTVAAVAGLATVMPQMPGFSMVLTVFDALPAVPGGVALIFVMTALVANPVPVFSSAGIASVITEKFASLSPATGMRLALSSQLCPCTPWCAGVINAVALTKIDLKTAAWYYFKSAFFPGIVALGAVLLMISAGIFI